MRLLIGAMLAALLAGCASQPAGKPEDAPAAAAKQAAISPGPAVAAAVAPGPAAGTAAKTQEGKSFAGYRKKTTANGQVLYCTKVAKTGSHFEKETCMSEAELQSMDERAKEDREMLRRRSQGPCTVGCNPDG